MLFGTKGKRTGNSTGAQAGLEKSSVNPGPAVKQEGVWRRKSNVNPGPFCEAGRCLAQEKAFYLVRKLRGVPPPSSVLSADVCLSMRFSMPFRVCITVGIDSCLVILWCVVVYFLL